jgi:hypothetical protein
MSNNEVMPAKVAEIACNYDVIEFVNGQQDCKDGVPHKDGMGESYDAGYRVQYELEQISGRSNFN